MRGNNANKSSISKSWSAIVVAWCEQQLILTQARSMRPQCRRHCRQHGRYAAIAAAANARSIAAFTDLFAQVLQLRLLGFFFTGNRGQGPMDNATEPIGTR